MMIGFFRQSADRVDESERFGEIFERSEEHTSELQSRQYLVCRLLLEKKKKSLLRHAAHEIALHRRDVADSEPLMPVGLATLRHRAARLCIGLAARHHAVLHSCIHGAV